MRIVVVGDVLLDRDLDGDSTRLAPDAPVPVVDVRSARSRAGGAGLVARLLGAEGHEVRLVTAMSDDAASRQLRACLRGVRLVAGPSGAPTPVKTRVLKAGEPVVRFDEGCDDPPAPTVTAAMLLAIREAEVIVVADYGRGLLAIDPIRDAIAARVGRIPVVWDPHPRGATPVAGVTAVTPNLTEAAQFAGLDPDPQGAPAAAAKLAELWAPEAVVVTVGEEGAWIHAEAGGKALPTQPLADVDTCGAGDRFASALAVALHDPAVPLEAGVAAAISSTHAYLAAGGVAALSELPGGSVPPREQEDAWEVAAAVRAAGGTVVATGGCFDLLHAGHLETLRAARALGDALIVCLNSDASVSRLKGPERPLLPERERAELLLALECVDAVVIFEENTPERVLADLRPDLWVKGGDYIAELLPEQPVMSRIGGRCVVVPFLPGRSTTALVDALQRTLP